jgi:hypothetical protein
MKTKLSLLATILCGLYFSVEAANDDEMRFYDVEIVIFKNDRGPKKQEFILPVSSPQIDDEILDLSSPRSIEAAREKLYEIVPNDELRLQQQVLSIVKSSRYSLLAHVAWRQPGLVKEQVMPVWIKGGRIYGDEFISIDNQIDSDAMHELDIFDLEDPSLLSESEQTETGQTSTESAASQLPSEANEPEAAQDSGETDVTSVSSQPTTELSVLEQELQDSINAELGLSTEDEQPVSGLYELEGKISIALARYLHTNADLVLRKPRISIQDPALDEIELGQLGEDIQSDTLILNNHSLKESRRMRSKKLHYLDSPEFSMLILITPYEVPLEPEIPDPELIDGIVESLGTAEN